VNKNDKLQRAMAWLGAKAERIAHEPKKAKKLVVAVYQKLGESAGKSKIVKLLQPLGIFKRMVMAHHEGKYKIPSKSLILICLGLLYFLIPTDFVPDFIPFFGYADDFSVIIAIFNKLKIEIDMFLVWEQKQQIQHD